MSFGKTSAGALQIKDNNDYYPFGMNHLKTGNAYFGAGSYKNYKFGGKELQEFGAYDFGARLYMNDIGRWFAVDPMAEANPGLSVYRYGFNNPIMFTDPNGMLEQAQIDHMWNNSGMGVTGWSFNKDGSPKKDSYNPMNDSDLNNLLVAFNGVASGGGSSTISFFTGSITQTSYRIGNELYTEGNFGLIHTITIRNEMNAGFDWYGPAGKVNFGFGTAATAIGFVQGSFRLTNGIYNGSAWSPKYYPSAWTGGSRARITTYNFGKVGRVLGRFSVGVGFLMDMKGMVVYQS